MSGQALRSQREHRRVSWRAQVCLLGALLAGVLWPGVPAAGARVNATLALGSVPSSVQTGQLATFTGTISPALEGERVVLQRLARNHWRHIGGGFRTGPGGSFSITHIFGVPSRGGPTLLRICLRRNALDFRSCSAPFAVTIVASSPPNLTARERHRLRVEAARKRRQERRLERLHRLQEKRQHKEEVRKRKAEARLKRIQAREERRSKRIQQREERRQRKEAARKLREEERLKRILAREEERKRKQEEAR